jgi:hypothetical protein
MKYGLIVVLMVIFGSYNTYADENYITIYNKDLGLVKQIRALDIKKALLPLKFTDVAAKLIPTSVHLKSVRGSKDFRVLEQNFEYDLVNSDKILEKYIDHPVEIINENGEYLKGVLLSKEGKSLVLKTDDGIKIVAWNDRMSINVKELPEGLITRPTLIWEISGYQEGQQTLEVSYLTKGMNWQAEYVGVLDEKSAQINLDAWVSVNNQSGATFEDAHLKLVAGDIHRAPEPQERYLRPQLMMAVEGGSAEGFEEREFFEYHIYDLDRLTTLKNNQMKQISLFPSAEVSCSKKFYYNARRDAKKVEVKIVFKNDEKSGLGRPLPAGVFRIYQKDQNSLEFVGEDRIDHTPRNEEVKLTVGKAFDLIGERKILEKKKISNRSEKQTVEIELRNNKEKENVNITIEEYMYYYSWEIGESNFPFTKKDAYHVEFNIPVKANRTATVNYSVVYSW